MFKILYDFENSEAPKQIRARLQEAEKP